MSRLVFGHDVAVANWASEKLDPKPDFPRLLAAIGVTNQAGDDLAGAAVLHNYSKYDVELSIYGPNAFLPGLVKAIAWIAFVRAGLQRISMRVPRRRKRILRAALKYGFHYEGVRKRMYGPNKSDDAVLFGIMKEDAARYLRNEHGRT